MTMMTWAQSPRARAGARSVAWRQLEREQLSQAQATPLQVQVQVGACTQHAPCHDPACRSPLHQATPLMQRPQPSASVSHPSEAPALKDMPNRAGMAG